MPRRCLQKWRDMWVRTLRGNPVEAVQTPREDGPMMLHRGERLGHQEPSEARKKPPQQASGRRSGREHVPMFSDTQCGTRQPQESGWREGRGPRAQETRPGDKRRLTQHPARPGRGSCFNPVKWAWGEGVARPDLRFQRCLSMAAGRKMGCGDTTRDP